MAHNRYYIINASDPNISQIEEVIVGTIEQQRPSLDETQITQIVVKLHEHDHHNYSFLADYQEQNHEQILTIMNTPEWTVPGYTSVNMG